MTSEPTGNLTLPFRENPVKTQVRLNAALRFNDHSGPADVWKFARQSEFLEVSF